MRQIWLHWVWGRAAGWSGEGCIPALSPRACPMPGGRSDRRSLLGVWAAPPMLLVDLTPWSAQESGAAVMGGWGVQWKVGWGCGNDGIIMFRSERVIGCARPGTMQSSMRNDEEKQKTQAKWMCESKARLQPKELRSLKPNGGGLLQL